MIKALFLASLLLSIPVSADSNVSSTLSQTTAINKNAEAYKLLDERLQGLEGKEAKGNIWTKIYSNYLTYNDLKTKEETLRKEAYRLRRIQNKTKEQVQIYDNNLIKIQTIESKLALLKEFQKDPFKRVVEPPKIEKAPKIGNPVGVLGAISYQKNLTNQQATYEASYNSLLDEVDTLKQKLTILAEMLRMRPNSKIVIAKIKYVKKELDRFKPVLEIFETTKQVYNKKIEETRLELDSKIHAEYEKLFRTMGIMGVFFILFMITKYILRRYMSNKDSFYTVNKVANFIFLTLLTIVLLFSYIENVSYMVTVIGFASAGIAIAMKDWFMSLMGWWVIMIGGSIHVGDRIKFVRDGVEYVGDIVDISPLRMSMQEDVTLTSYTTNRRSGRIIFIPNNFVFTDMIANYSHSGLKTVWDGIDVSITFDSNISKALSISKEVTKKYSKGYTDITRKQLNGLRSQYHIKNTNVEPRIFSFIEPHGMVISAWYLTNAFATLTLRSKISAEIIEKIQQRDDIHIAYPTQSIHLNNSTSKADLPNINDNIKETET